MTEEKDGLKISSKENNFKIFYALSLAWQLGFLIAIPIGGFLLLGLLGDNFLGTKPLFLIVGLMAGLSITVYEAYHWLIPLIKDRKK